jgi:hypothetical protein
MYGTASPAITSSEQDRFTILNAIAVPTLQVVSSSHRSGLTDIHAAEDAEHAPGRMRSF